MILCDSDILARLERGDITITPAANLETQLQPASLDLRLGYDFQTFNYTRQALIDPRDPATFEQLTSLTQLQDGERFLVHPGEFTLATTLEHVEIPNDLLAQLEGRSSIGRLGIVIHSTAGYVDPGFKGKITLEISNTTPLPAKIYANEGIAQLIFLKGDRVCAVSYADKRGKYQDQPGLTLPRVD